MYSTVFDVRNALTPGADSADSTTAAMLQDDQIEDAILEADAMIDTYLATGYAVPTVDITRTVESVEKTFTVGKGPFRWWSRDIAAYLATLTYRRNKDIAEEDPIRLRFAMVLTMLEGIKSGETTIPVDDDGNLGQTGQDVFAYPYYEGNLFDTESFGLEKRNGWIPPHHMYSGRLW